MILNQTQSKFFNSPIEMMDLLPNDLQDDLSPLGNFSDFEGYEVWGFFDQNQPKATREAFERKLNLNSLYKKVHSQKPRGDQTMRDKLNTTDSFQYRVEPLLEGNEQIITERRIYGKGQGVSIDFAKNKKPGQTTQRLQGGLRRKSDVSSWSGGGVRLDAKTSFMTFWTRPENCVQNQTALDSIRSPKGERKKMMTSVDISKKSSKPSQPRAYTTLVKLKSSHQLEKFISNGPSINVLPENLAASMMDNSSQREPKALVTSITNAEQIEQAGNEYKSQLSLENENNLRAVAEEVYKTGVGHGLSSHQKQTHKPKIPTPEKPKTVMSNIRPLSQQWKPREFRISKNPTNHSPVELRETAKSKKLDNKKPLPQILDQREQRKTFKHLRIVSNNSSLKASSIFGGGQRNLTRSISNSTFRDFQPVSANPGKRVKGVGSSELRHWTPQSKIILHSQPDESISASSLTNSGFFRKTGSNEIRDQNSVSPSRMTQLRNAVLEAQGLTRLKTPAAAAADKKMDLALNSKRTKLAKLKVKQMKTIYARVLPK